MIAGSVENVIVFLCIIIFVGTYFLWVRPLILSLEIFADIKIIILLKSLNTEVGKKAANGTDIPSQCCNNN